MQAKQTYGNKIIHRASYRNQASNGKSEWLLLCHDIVYFYSNNNKLDTQLSALLPLKHQMWDRIKQLHTKDYSAFDLFIQPEVEKGRDEKLICQFSS